MTAAVEHRYSPIVYARVTVRLPTEGGRSVNRTFWVKPGPRSEKRVRFTVVDKEGDPCPENTLHFLICTPEDIVNEQPARLNLHYAELELAP